MKTGLAAGRGGWDAAARTDVILLGLFAGVLAWSAVRPHDYPTWVLEVFPALVGVGVLVAVRHRVRLTTFCSVCVLLHATILAVGGRYTYALNPPFEWLREALGWQRNYYDRLGHLAQGFFPALIAREVLVRSSPLKRGGWLAFTVICFCLALSACYEFVEWWAALLLGSGADAFLGAQGDVWDTQWDMFLALVGAVLAVATMSRAHDRALAKAGLPRPPAAIPGSRRTA